LPTHKEVYERHASAYEDLVSREDYEGNILKAIQEIMPLRDLDVLDLGAGTGRLACMLAPHVRTVLAFDLSHHMLKVARDKLGRLTQRHWLAAAADHRYLPLKARSADLVISGWSVSYVAVWHPRDWRDQLNAWIDEARRVAKEHGWIVLIESLGTGAERPQPLAHLEDFYVWLDHEGFGTKWIRTDYRFDTLESAEQLTGFFFGEEMKTKIKREPRPILPECTGVWWLRM
jgi:ubiquinone/menaquinone biosynthesis C-methylase UbiE